jgi:hypothetical protein
MIRIRRLLLALPFAYAALFTALALASRDLHLDNRYIEKHVFLFAAPWDWLIDSGLFTFHTQSRWARHFFTFFALLWFPAFLYAGCLWLFFRGFGACSTWRKPPVKADRYSKVIEWYCRSAEQKEPPPTTNIPGDDSR